MDLCKKGKWYTINYTNFFIISLTSSITIQALCPPITSAFISPSFHSCTKNTTPCDYLFSFDHSYSIFSRKLWRLRGWIYLNGWHFLCIHHPYNPLLLLNIARKMRKIMELLVKITEINGWLWYIQWCFRASPGPARRCWHPHYRIWFYHQN